MSSELTNIVSGFSLTYCIHYSVPQLLAKSLQELEDKKRKQITGQATSLASSAPIVVIDQETTKQGKSVTQMRKLDAAVANAVDFDLGDF